MTHLIPFSKIVPKSALSSVPIICNNGSFLAPLGPTIIYHFSFSSQVNTFQYLQCPETSLFPDDRRYGT